VTLLTKLLTAPPGWYASTDRPVASWLKAAAVSPLADVDPIVVPAPQVVHMVSREEIARLLPPLHEIPALHGHRARICGPTQRSASTPKTGPAG